MRILVVSLFTEWSHHFGTELEIAQRHIDCGDSVEVLGCDHSVGRCRVNTDGNRNHCEGCAYKRILGVGLLSQSVRIHPIGAYVDVADVAKERTRIAAIDGRESLKAYEVDGIDVGWAALSTTVDVFRDANLENPAAKDIARSQCEAAVKIGSAVKRFLAAQPRFDRVYLFNGRWSTSRAVFRACQQAGIEVVTHERASSVDKFMLYEGHLPHSRDNAHRLIGRAWDEADEAHRDTVGRRFYEDARNGITGGWKSFIACQERDRLPDGWHPGKRNIVIFNSSDDEFAGIDASWAWPFYTTQSDEIRRIVEEMSTLDPDARVTLRMHPNLKGVENRDVRQCHAIKADNFVLIPPEAPVSSYDLIEAADVVVTFGSTVGIEATYWRRPSIVAGPSYYERLGATHNPASHEELMRLLLDELEVKPIDGAIRYGYYRKTCGTPFRHFKPVGLFEGTFNGCDLGSLGRDALRRKAFLFVARCGLGNGPAAGKLVDLLAFAGRVVLWPLRLHPAGRRWLERRVPRGGPETRSS